MPRVGLTTADVVAVGAQLADEHGIAAVTFASVAVQLGVKPPALYRHVASVGELHRQIATLAMVELGDALREALQGASGRAAITAVFTTVSTYIAHHPGRYSATTGQQFGGPDDPLLVAATRVIGSLRAVMQSYNIPEPDLDHAIRVMRCTIHGYASLQAANAFQWSNDPHDSARWMAQFFDAGLLTLGARSGTPRS